jgi:hypothetical protein
LIEMAYPTTLRGQNGSGIAYGTLIEPASRHSSCSMAWRTSTSVARAPSRDARNERRSDASIVRTRSASDAIAS